MIVLSPSEAFIRKHLRFNFAVGLLDGGFFGLGMGFASFSAIIPLFVHHFTESAILIGLVPSIHNLGWQLPQLLTAGWLSRARRFKPLTLQMTIHERLPFLGLAVVALLVPQMPGTSILVLTFLLLIWQGFGAGMAANPWTNLVSKVIPQELHGTFFGTQSAAFNGLAAAASLAASVVLERLATPTNYSVCFALTFVFMAISFGFLSATREPESIHGEAGAPATSLPGAMQILKRDANFRAFLLIRILSQFAGMGFAFYAIYAVQQYTLTDAEAAALVSILLIGQVILSPLMGRLGDRWSHRGAMSLGAIGATLSALIAWKATSAGWFYAVFLLEAIAVVAIWTIPLALSVSFAHSEAERPIYIGMANTLPAPAAILAPIAGGWIADAAGYGTMFVVAAISGLLMAAGLWFVLKEPAERRIAAA